MLSIDTNILFEACESSRPRHGQAVDYLRAISDRRDAALCELVLVELYVLLRNPAMARRPLTASRATELIQRFRQHPHWRLIDYPGTGSTVADELWKRAAEDRLATRAIFDTRLALTLRHHGVTEFATRNVKDFQGFGFKRVFDPLA